jgi:hypothetical protein
VQKKQSFFDPLAQAVLLQSSTSATPIRGLYSVVVKKIDARGADSG